MTRRVKVGIGVVVILSVIAFGVWWVWQNKLDERSITTFSECADAGYPIAESYPEQCMTPDERVFVNEYAIAPGSITVIGEMVCLPHKDTTGPQTMECAFGLLDESGVYYALRDTDPMYGNVSGVGMGVLVEVVGTFTPQSDTKYRSIGVIEVLELSPIEK